MVASHVTESGAQPCIGGLGDWCSVDKGEKINGNSQILRAKLQYLAGDDMMVERYVVVGKRDILP